MDDVRASVVIGANEIGVDGVAPVELKAGWYDELVLEGHVDLQSGR